MKQQFLFKERHEVEFGGSLIVGRRKTRRPFNRKLPIHHILKATNPYILLRHQKRVRQILFKMAKRFSIQIHSAAVQADHVHTSLLAGSRDNYNRWARSVTGIISRELKVKWLHRPYTRLVTWGKQFKVLENYIKSNEREGNFILSAHLRVDDWLKLALGP